MICPKCGAPKMTRDKPVYFNRDNREGDTLFQEEILRCRICGKVVFANKVPPPSKKRFIKGQVITGGYEDL